jgi:hypothetical protein
MKVIGNRLTVTRANVPGKHGAGGAQAHAAGIVHDRGQIVGGRHDQETGIGLRVVREP